MFYLSVIYLIINKLLLKSTTKLSQLVACGLLLQPEVMSIHQIVARQNVAGKVRPFGKWSN
jgi:hypothetical protein